MSNELKPCPFCGGEAQYSEESRFHISWVYCSNCGAASGYRNTEAEAIAAWNTRADEAPECEQEEFGWGTEGDHARVWLTCGHDCMVATVADLPNYCPTCGAKVRKPEPQVIKNAENYKLADDSKPQIIVTGEKHKSADKPDSRERLEADVRQILHSAYMLAWMHGYENRRGSSFEKLHVEFYNLLDRQAAITHELDNVWARAQQTRIAELTAERDELEAERNRLQRVAKVQADSFLKIERENRELQDACGELERTIENLRGME